MVAGRLSKPIVLERMETKLNQYGEEESSYIPYSRTKAEIIFSGKEKYDLGIEIKYIDEIEIHLRFYFYKMVKPFDRILYLNQTYEVMKIIPDENNQMLILKCIQTNE